LTPLRVSGAWRRAFDGWSESARHPALRAYLADLGRPYGLGLREDLLGEGSGQSYPEMAGALLAGTLPADQPVDLLVLAFAVTDTVPMLSGASYLSRVCPGEPMAFAVCDQGSAAPFSGLRLISDYARTGGCRRAVLVIAEQAAIYHDLAVPAAAPTANAVVAMACGESGPARLDAVRLHPDVGPGQARELLAEDLSALSRGHDDVTLITGASAPDPTALGVPAAVQVLTAPAGQPCTGVWWEFAGCLPEWSASSRRVLLADYDPLLGNLCVSALDISPE
jgi:hypothetical protein